jgi:hypothetical protein
LTNFSYYYLITLLIWIAYLPKIISAYIGPGTSLSAIGAFLACVIGAIVTIIGFFWYPIKRLLGKKSQEPNQVDNEIK